MNNLGKLAIIAMIAFATPMVIAAYSNRENLEPFMIGDVETTRGELLYFARKG